MSGRKFDLDSIDNTDIRDRLSEYEDEEEDEGYDIAEDEYSRSELLRVISEYMDRNDKDIINVDNITDIYVDNIIKKLRLNNVEVLTIKDMVSNLTKEVNVNENILGGIIMVLDISGSVKMYVDKKSMTTQNKLSYIGFLESCKLALMEYDMGITDNDDDEEEDEL